MISTKPSGLFLHVKSKHDKEIATPEKCFPALKGFDPANPDVARRRPALARRRGGEQELAEPGAVTNERSH